MHVRTPVRLAAALVAVGAVLAVPTGNAGVARTSGFEATAPQVRCALDLPHRQGLFCATTLIKRGAYDKRGVVRLGPHGRAQIVASGSDLLLYIDGNGDHTARSTLPADRAWRHAGYSCTDHAGMLTCRRGSHGFTLFRTLRTF
jgi:hypothetical protein